MSVYRIVANKLRTTQLLSVETETPTIKTFTFRDKECSGAKPGQFVMLWIPGVDEIPLSIADARPNGNVSVAVRNVGLATAALHGMNVGEVVGVRGPFGNNFTSAKGDVLMVAGGTGMAPLHFLTRQSASRAKRLAFVLGAKTMSELLYMDELRRLLMKARKNEFIVSTEDGTCGITGLCTTPVERLLAEDKFDMVYACGPEPMIVKVFESAEKHGVGFEASLERLMRCAVGLCGSCVIGKYRVCADGPVFTAEQLREVKEEFGKTKLDFDGSRKPLA